MPETNPKGWKVLNRDEVDALLRLGDEHHKDKQKPWPTDVVELRMLIEVKTRNAELFMARVGAIDYGMIHEIVELKLQLDGAYGRYVQSETGTLH